MQNLHVMWHFLEKGKKKKMIIEAKKQFYSWLQSQWDDCEIIFHGQQKEPAGTTWMRVYILRELAVPSIKLSFHSEAEINFSIFTSDSSNLYLLDALEEKLRSLCEKRRLCFDAGNIEFREFTSTTLTEQPTTQMKLQKILYYKSIMATAYICKRR